MITAIGLDQARGLLTSLFDDAAIFPPGNAPMPSAVTDHRRHAASWYHDLVGPFLCAASRVPELQQALGAGCGLDPVTVVLVADTGVLGVEQARNLLLDDDRVDLVGLEVALPRQGDPAVFARHVLDALSFGVPAAVEVPFAPGWQGALDVLADDGAERVKFRTGGPAGADIPAPGQLAELISAAVARRLPFKLTAGLHHPVRGMESTDGAAHHGFLNALSATAVAVDGGGVEEVTGLLAATDPGVILGPLREADVASVRARFTSFGTCSIVDPVTDLVGLGMLEAEPS